MSRTLLAAAALLLVGCAKHPPPDFAPDPMLVDRIVELRIVPRVPVACPGEAILVEYEAVLDDGTRIPFARSYDEDAPPDLHIVFLDRWSPEAAARGDGHWQAAGDPLVSAMEGFRLHAAMRVAPEIEAVEVLAPEYSCLPHVFSFEGPSAGKGEWGRPGPDVLLRLGVLSSPYYERLLVLGIEVGDAPPFYVLQDADRVEPADWFRVASVGGRGGGGITGERGAPGRSGRNGCPGERGGTGGVGGPGGPGFPGGPGGPITVMVEQETPFLAGLIDGASVGGRGGPGGRGGNGGPGGDGGRGVSTAGRTCEDGPRGEGGPRGESGPDGPVGPPGNPPRVIAVSTTDVFGAGGPTGLQSLVDFSRN